MLIGKYYNSNQDYVNNGENAAQSPANCQMVSSQLSKPRVIQVAL